MNEAQTRLELIDPALRAAGWTDENGWRDSFDAVQYWFDAVKKPRYYQELAVNRQDDPLSHRSGVAAGARGHGAAFLDKHPPKGRQEGVLAAPRCVDEPRRAGCAIQRLDPETIRTDVIPIVVVVSRAHHAEPETREERQRPVASGPIPAADHDILMLCQTPEDLLKLLENLPVKPEWVNVGNFGRVAAKKPDGTMRKTYAPNLYLYDEEKEALKKVLALGIKTIYQTTPEDTPEPLDKLLG